MRDSNVNIVVINQGQKNFWGYTLPWSMTMMDSNVEKNHTNAANATMNLFKHTIWGDIWEVTLAKNRTNVTNATMHLFKLSIWGDIWKITQAKSSTNANNATMHLFKQAIWGHIWKLTLQKSNKCYQYDYASVQASDLMIHLRIETMGRNHIDATIATMHLFGRVLWGHTKELIKEKLKCN